MEDELHDWTQHVEPSSFSVTLGHFEAAVLWTIFLLLFHRNWRGIVESFVSQSLRCDTMYMTIYMTYHTAAAKLTSTVNQSASPGPTVRRCDYSANNPRQLNGSRGRY